jgi:hypothetical protein
MADDKLNEIVSLMDMLIDDTSVPKNIRKVVQQARDHLKSNEELTTKVSSAIYSLDGVDEDINMPMHARTQIWTMLSALESLEKE